MPFKKRARKSSQFAVSEILKRRMLQKELDDGQAVETSRLASDGRTLQHRPTHRRSLRQLQESFLVNRDEETITEIIKLVFGFQPRSKQLAAIMCVVRGNDLILLAKTSFGKSLIPQSIPFILQGSIVIVILPLNVIGHKQCSKLAALPGARPIHVSSENFHLNGALVDIRSGAYTHIYISPELICNPTIFDILTDPTFKMHVVLVVINELHLVENWKHFRKEYALLYKRRSMLKSVPFVGLTATCDQHTLVAIKEIIRSRLDTTIIRTEVDRAEISITFKKIAQSKFSAFESLYFILDQTSIAGDPRPLDIPKSLFFVDTKAILLDCRQKIWEYLQILINFDQSMLRTVVKGYHSSLTDETRLNIYKAFRRPDSGARIIVCTDAMAHGANVPDIKICVQFGIFREPTLYMVWQRLDRAARGPGMTANFIWCVESLYFSSEPQPRMTPRCNHHHELRENEIFIDENLQRKSDRQKRAELLLIIYLIINSSTCARHTIVLYHYPDELVTVSSE
ncbi:hypothetical protein K3495_g10018 [Podosphaera aphanis]|nr:hypothetical protein K3495_g10018 [Podosphaera aphanis]